MNKSEVELIATVYTEADTGDTVADGDWSYTSSASLFDDPYDIMGVSWEETDYDFQEQTEYSGGNTTHHRTTGFDGVSFNIDDGAQDGFGDPDEYGWGGIYLDGTENIENRKIIVNYTHTWNTTTVESVGFNSSGGLVVTLDSEGRQWDSPLQAFDSDNKQF